MQAVTAMESAAKTEELASGVENRRAVPRFDVDEDAHILLVKHGSTLPCRVVDLSLNGCRMRAKERFPAGAMVRVEVSFRVRGLAFRFSGMTQWTDGQSLVGIRFLDVPARRKEELVEALSEVEEENAAKAAKLAAEKQAAEEEAAAREAASTPVAEQAEEEEQEQSPAQSPARSPAQGIAAQNLPWPRSVSSLPMAPGPQMVPKAGNAVAGLSGSQAGSHPAKLYLAERPPASTSSGTPQPPAPQKTEARPAGSPPKPSARERRVQSREAVDTTAVIDLIKIASRLQGRILDLSLNGCRIRADEHFPVGIYTRVETEFRLEGLPFRLGGVIQAIHDRRTVGIRFLDMSNRKREQVEQLIEEIRELRKEERGNRE
jgi:c-di-GMP-binding flagellar brake protein YcgR